MKPGNCSQGHPYESLSSGFVLCRTCRVIEKIRTDGTTTAGTDRELAYELGELLANAYGLVSEYQSLQDVNDAATEIFTKGGEIENAELFKTNHYLAEQNRLLVEIVGAYRDTSNQALDIGQRATARDKALNGAAQIICTAVSTNILARETEPLYLRLETAARATLVYLRHMKLQLAETLVGPLRELDHARNPRSIREEDESLIIKGTR